MQRPNIIVISVDALRADRLGCYGYPRATSPFIDSLAGEGVLCERLYCPAIPTVPSYTTLYTGQHPMTHGVVAHPSDNPLDRRAPFLPWELLRAGYTTCAVDSLQRLRNWFGQGYEFYIDPSQRHPLLYLGATCEDLNRRAIPWLRHHANEPFFFFIHYWDTHWPLVPPQRYRHLFYQGNPTDPSNHSLDGWWTHPHGILSRDTWLRTPEGLITDAEYLAALYDQEIRYLDDGVRALLTAVDELGLTEHTLVVFTADHGESLTEHGIFFEHHGLYECTLRVPLIVRWPSRIPRGVRLPHVLQVSDIAPTLLEAAGVPIPSAMEGQSFLRLLLDRRGDGGHQRVISLECSWQMKWSLRTDHFKLILSRWPDRYGNPPRELYDLMADPTETRNIVEERRDIADAMEAELERWIADRLRALGRERDPLVVHGISLGKPTASSGRNERR